jgi:glycerol-3-phosphate dehydrogenase
MQRARQLMPALLEEEVTTMYAGLRAATEHSDYVIDADPGAGYVCVGGIRSTGLTASLAIAEHVRELLEKNGVSLSERRDLPPTSRVPNIGEAFPRPYQCAELIEEDPEYGTVVCFCERVTRGEVRDALLSAVPPRDLDGLRRRTRVLMGRCQGFFCGAEVQRLLDQGVSS